jgi:AraC-like DNA-binding protein
MWTTLMPSRLEATKRTRYAACVYSQPDQLLLPLQPAPRTLCGVAAKLFFARAQALYLGPAFGLSPHRNAVPVLCASLAGRFQVAVDARSHDRADHSCRVALIPANTLHHLRIDTAPMAFLYLDAHSVDFQRLRARCGRFDGRLGRGLRGERRYLAALERLRHGAPWSEIRKEIAAALDLYRPVRSDARITAAVRQLHDDPEDASLASLARAAGMSHSRFLHLFKQDTGVPFRRYRLWARMGSAVRSMLRGASLTEAALDAGFSSSAHFSAAFREMFGMAPSMLAGYAPRIVEDGARRIAQPVSDSATPG